MKARTAPKQFNKRSWKELVQHFRQVGHVAARLQHRSDSGLTLFTTIAARMRQDGLTRRQVIVQLVREMRAAKRAAGAADVPADTCPYCGGAYTVERTCYGPRVPDAPERNTCKRMRKHRRMVRAALDHPRSEADDRG